MAAVPVAEVTDPNFVVAEQPALHLGGGGCFGVTPVGREFVPVGDVAAEILLLHFDLVKLPV